MPPIVTTRRMTEEERAILLQPPVRLFGWWSGMVTAVLAFAVVFLLVGFSAVVLPYTWAVRAALIAGILAALAWYGGIQRRLRRQLAELSATAAREAATGTVQSAIYRISDAIAVAEAEDEGLSYFLLLDDGQTLFLSGQYLYEPTDQGFPWESFEVVTVASGDWVLRVVPLGPPLAPGWTRGPFTDAELESGKIPEDGAIELRDFAALKTAIV